MTTLRIGAHVGKDGATDDPIAAGAARQADLVQIFLGDPQGWKDPVVPYAGGADALQAAAAEAGLDVYVHAPWAKTFERWDPPLPVLIENTAGGEGAMVRRVDRLARLWEVFEDRLDPAVLAKVGFCLDTCHAHAGGEDLSGVVDRVKAATGRVDLVHCNDSRDEFDSGADRHANFGQGHIEGDDLVAVVSAAGAPVVCETPGGADGQAADIAWLRERLPA